MLFYYRAALALIFAKNAISATGWLQLGGHGLPLLATSLSLSLFSQLIALS